MSDLTYGSLAQTLHTLGFKVRDNHDQKARVYEHPGGAAIYLPFFEEDTRVQPRHLLTVRGTLEAFGLPDPFAGGVSQEVG